jgi:hypothetical protein
LKISGEEVSLGAAIQRSIFSLYHFFPYSFRLFECYLPQWGTDLAGEMDRFFWAVGTDLPWEDPQIRYRLGTDNHEVTIREA